MKNKIVSAVRRQLSTLALAVTGLIAAASVAKADGNIDFTTARDFIKTDLTTTLPLGLVLFAFTFGIVIVKGFFKKTTH